MIVLFTRCFSFLLLYTDPSTTWIYTLSLHDALPIFEEPISCRHSREGDRRTDARPGQPLSPRFGRERHRSEEHTSELQSRGHLVCRLLLEKKKKYDWEWSNDYEL